MATLMPDSPVRPTGADRAVTSATTTPEPASASRSSRSTLRSSTMPSLILSRSTCCDPIEAPLIGGICQRVCGPPGPLNEPRESMLQMPV